MRHVLFVVFLGCALPSRAVPTQPPSAAAAPATPAPVAPVVFSVATGNIVRGWSADAFEDGRVEARLWGHTSPGDDPKPCTSRLTPARLAEHAHGLARCCGMRVHSLSSGDLPVDQRHVEVHLGERACKTVQSDRVWRGNTEASACWQAVMDFRQETCVSQ